MDNVTLRQMLTEADALIEMHDYAASLISSRNERVRIDGVVRAGTGGYVFPLNKVYWPAHFAANFEITRTPGAWSALEQFVTDTNSLRSLRASAAKVTARKIRRFLFRIDGARAQADAQTLAHYLTDTVRYARQTELLSAARVADKQPIDPNGAIAEFGLQ